MIATATPNALLHVVAQSPAAVAAHDKDRWLGLWAPNFVLEDPVGSRPVLGGLFDRRSGERGNAALSRFWDAFIATNNIRFDVHHDFVSQNRVVRDVTISTTLPSGARAVTPAHLLYELVEHDGAVKIRRMAAHWEPLPVFGQWMRPSAVNVRALSGMTVRTVRYLGLGGTARFGLAAFGVGAKGKRAVTDLVSRAQRGQRDAVALLGGTVPAQLSKVIAAGDTVTATCQVDSAPAVLVITLNRRTRRVVTADVFRDEHRHGSRQLRAVVEDRTA
jgi:hypothetical protein